MQKVSSLISYQSTQELLTTPRNLGKTPSGKLSPRLSPAMDEYLQTRYFSPDLEMKKISNLDAYFLEKYQIVTNLLNEPKTYKDKMPEFIRKFTRNMTKKQTTKPKKVDPFIEKLQLIEAEVDLMFEKTENLEKSKAEMCVKNKGFEAVSKKKRRNLTRSGLT